MQEKIKNALKKRILSYKNRKQLNIKLSDLIAYDSILFFKKDKRREIGRKIFTSFGRSLALSDYELKFTEKSDVNEVFCDKIYQIYKEFIPKKEQVVADIGAQYGDYAILCSKVYKAKVYTFEPLPDNFKEIEENIKLNDLTEKEVKAFNVALSDENKEKYITFDGDMANSIGKGKKIRIKFRTLDSYKIKPDIIKIDVEGFEVNVLRGAIKTIKKYKPKIIIETHSRELEEQVKEMLTSLVYKLKHEGRAVYNVNEKFDKVTNLFFSVD